MQQVRNLRSLAAGLAGMLVLAACGGDSGPSGTSTLSQLQADTVGAAAAGQIGDLAGGITSFDFTGGTLGGGFFSRAALRERMSTLQHVVPSRYLPQLAMLRAGSCDPAVVGDSTDTDGDGIVNNATYTFTPANCFYQDSLGNGFAVTGSVSVEDTDGGTTLFGFGIDFNHLKVLLYNDSASAGIDWDGTDDATVTSANLTTNQAFRSRVFVNNQPIYATRYHWGLTFVPDTGTIDPATQQILPDGTFNLAGTFGWSGQSDQVTGDWTFNITTPTLLHWSISCAGDEPPFDAGQIRATINGRSSIGFTADYTACDTPPIINTFDTNAPAN